MALDDKHAQYSHNENIWRKCRDVVEGQEAVHAQGEVYLDKLSGQSQKEYEAYVNRALFYNATQRTVDAMSGLLFRKNPQITIPAGTETWLENIDLNGNTLDTMVQRIADDLLALGRYGVLVDHPQTPTDGTVTRAIAEEQNIRPFLVGYKAEDIINWSTRTVNNVKTLGLVVLREVLDVVSNEFDHDDLIQYRVLDLDGAVDIGNGLMAGGYYRQRVFQQLDEKKKDFTLIQEIFPKLNGEFMREIPFIFLGSIGTGADVEKSPILDLVNTNLSHYKTTADLEHGAHFTGLPTAVVTGHRISEGETLKIGSSEAWCFAEPEAKAFYLEFTGAGLESLLSLQRAKEDKMAALGARMLANEKASAETAETHLIKRQGENSALATLANAISDGITKALTILSTWGGFDGDVEFIVNKDFITTTMDSATLLALVQAWQSGAIAFNDLIAALQKGEIITEDRTAEDIKQEIELEGPKNGTEPGAGDTEDPNGETDPAA